MPSPLIIDCDTGRDDALAIWIALAMGKPLHALVASYGNVVRENVIDNCVRVLAFAGRGDIAVLPGAALPSRAHKGLGAVVEPRQKTSGNGLCNLELPVPGEALPGALPPKDLAQAIRDIADTHGKIDYVITGPATNFASICADVADCIARITMMGGKLEPLWAELPGADFNILCDPFAVDLILKSGIPTRFVTMNTTWPIVMDVAHLQALAPKTDIAAFSKDLMIAHATQFAPEPVFRFHDPAVIALLDDKNFAPSRVLVNCDEASPDFARLTEDESGYPVRIHCADSALRADALERMLGFLGF